MLNKKNRLKKRKSFAYMYRNGTAHHTKFLTLISVPNKSRDVKIGFSVSKKVGKAYLRNLIKRRLSEVVRENIDSINSSFNYIIVAKPGIADLSYANLKKELLTLLTKSEKIS